MWDLGGLAFCLAGHSKSVQGEQKYFQTSLDVLPEQLIRETFKVDSTQIADPCAAMSGAGSGFPTRLWFDYYEDAR